MVFDVVRGVEKKNKQKNMFQVVFRVQCCLFDFERTVSKFDCFTLSLVVDSCLFSTLKVKIILRTRVKSGQVTLGY